MLVMILPFCDYLLFIVLFIPSVVQTLKHIFFETTNEDNIISDLKEFKLKNYEILSKEMAGFGWDNIYILVTIA